MKKKVLLALLVLVLLSAMVIGARTFEGNGIHFEDSRNLTTEMYMGSHGWSVVYDTQFFDMSEYAAGQDINLAYTGECKGSTYVELEEDMSKSAKELIAEKKAMYEQTSDIYDFSTETASGYVFYVPGISPKVTEGDNRYTSVTVYKLKDNGSLVVTLSQQLDDEIEVSSRLAEVINSIDIY